MITQAFETPALQSARETPVGPIAIDLDGFPVYVAEKQTNLGSQMRNMRSARNKTRDADLRSTPTSREGRESVNRSNHTNASIQDRSSDHKKKISHEQILFELTRKQEPRYERRSSLTDVMISETPKKKREKRRPHKSMSSINSTSKLNKTEICSTLGQESGMVPNFDVPSFSRSENPSTSGLEYQKAKSLSSSRSKAEKSSRMNRCSSLPAFNKTKNISSRMQQNAESKTNATWDGSSSSSSSRPRTRQSSLENMNNKGSSRDHKSTNMSRRGSMPSLNRITESSSRSQSDADSNQNATWDAPSSGKPRSTSRSHHSSRAEVDGTSRMHKSSSLPSLAGVSRSDSSSSSRKMRSNSALPSEPTSTSQRGLRNSASMNGLSTPHPHKQKLGNSRKSSNKLSSSMSMSTLKTISESSSTCSQRVVESRLNSNATWDSSSISSSNSRRGGSHVPSLMKPSLSRNKLNESMHKMNSGNASWGNSVNLRQNNFHKPATGNVNKVTKDISLKAQMVLLQKLQMEKGLSPQMEALIAQHKEKLLLQAAQLTRGPSLNNAIMTNALQSSKMYS